MTLTIGGRRFRKSSRSAQDSGGSDCVYLAADRGAVADSKSGILLNVDVTSLLALVHRESEPTQV